MCSVAVVGASGRVVNSRVKSLDDKSPCTLLLYAQLRRSDNVVVATIEGEIEGKCFPGRRRTVWIDDVRRWTGDDMNVARTNAMERRYTTAVAVCLRVVWPTAYEQQQLSLLTLRGTFQQFLNTYQLFSGSLAAVPTSFDVS